MSGSSPAQIGRRLFITRGAAAGAVATLATDAKSRQLDLLASPPGAAVLVHDPRLAVPQDVLRRIAANGTRTVTLTGDPVWFWRSPAADCMRDPATSLMGVTGWAELLVFRGLAAETRRHLRYERLAGEGTFIWLMA